MPPIEATQAAPIPSTRSRNLPGRWVFLATCLFVLALLAILPPLISVNRYQRRIATSISTSLGRPVHFDQVNLRLLPVPGFTISNFVVEEDRAFGSEPILRANTVTANLRVSSIWKRPIEVSRISFTDPSINLVHDANGQWNFEGILLQAAHIDTAPTAQRSRGRTPRFPYIEATGARLNLKQGYEKTPFSLTEADFALWLSDPQTWHTRLQGHPVRTDTSVSDTGTLQMEGTLGRATSLDSVPLDIDAVWNGAPLGEASRLLSRRDLGLRGSVTLSASMHGTLTQSRLRTTLQVAGLRRSDFVPARTLSINVECTGIANRSFHALDNVRCSWPVPDAGGATVAIAGSVPDTLHPSLADLQLGTSPLPVSVLLTWLRIASSRLPPDLEVDGLLSGSISHDPHEVPPWASQWTIPDLQLSGSRLGPAGLHVERLLLHSVPTVSPPHTSSMEAEPLRLLLSPVALPLGAKDPATLEGVIDASGYDLHLTGEVLTDRLAALGATVPQFGDGLPQWVAGAESTGPVSIDISAHRAWGGEQTWTDNSIHGLPVSNRFTPKGRKASKTHH